MRIVHVERFSFSFDSSLVGFAAKIFIKDNKNWDYQVTKSHYSDRVKADNFMFDMIDAVVNNYLKTKEGEK